MSARCTEGSKARRKCSQWPYAARSWSRPSLNMRAGGRVMMWRAHYPEQATLAGQRGRDRADPSAANVLPAMDIPAAEGSRGSPIGP
eukprot:scaffold51036_cov65-Phaeocystis_antarctica.AAC.8